MINSKTKQAMPNQRFKKSLLAVSIVALSAPAFAQTDNSSEETMEEVVVVGMRTSINSAQELKRNADTVKDVITASDIGSLPDKSVTEALQRVPGVTIERFASSSDPKHYADEGTGVLVRGLDRVRSEVNGRDAFSANRWGGLSYEDFPAELLGAVEVVKNQTADLISGGIAGTVNLITRKPFDSDERMIAVGAKANYGDFREEVTPSFNALFSDRWDTSAGEFGFLISGSRTEFDSRGDGVGMGNYHARGTDNTPNASWDIWGTSVGPGLVEGMYDGPCVPNALGWMPECNGVPANIITAAEAYRSPFDGPALPGQPDGSTWYAPANYHMSTAENDRRRTGFTTSLQWQNTDETIVATLEHINSEASLEWRERVIASGAQGFDRGAGGAVIWSADEANDRPITVDSNGFLTSGIGRTTDVNFPLNLRSRWNYNENTVEDTSFNLELKPSDNLTIALDVQHVDSEQIVHNYSMSSQVRGGTTADVAPFFLDLRGDTPKIEYLSDRVSNPTMVAGNPDMFLGTGMEQETYAEAKMDAFKLDVEYALDGAWTAIKGGAYFSDKDLSMGDTEYSNWVAIGTPWDQTARFNASTNNRPELFERVSFADYYHGDVLQGPNNSFLFPKMDLVKEWANTLENGCGKWNALGNATDGSGDCAKGYRSLNNRIDGPFAAQDISSSNQKRTELYTRADFALDDLAVPIKGNVGLRYVNYKLKSTGYVVLPPTSARGGFTSGGDPTSLYNVIQNNYPDLFALASGEATRSAVDGADYDTVLPSLNLTFGVADDVIVRFGASQGLYYPGLEESRNTMLVSMGYTRVLQDPDQPYDEGTNPVVDITDIALNATVRNPFLEPEESTNFDLTTEWYFADAGSLSIGLFHKKLDNIIRNESYLRDIDYADNTYSLSVVGPANTGSGTIQGVELSYSQFYDFLPGAFSGLGLQFNYTYIDQNDLEDPGTVSADIRFTPGGAAISDGRNSFRAFTGLPLEGYSDENANIVGMYEYNDISFRLAYTWRSDYLLTRRESEEFVSAYNEASGMMDASLYYTLTENLKVGLEASNILKDDTKTQYQMDQAGTKTDALSFTTDRRYALSVRATF